MFAIDCLKVNGTHLGTCIDRFYFGSCCLIEPFKEIIDNTIETEMLDEREPPMRITNTTAKPEASTLMFDNITLVTVKKNTSHQSSTIHINILKTTLATPNLPGKSTPTNRPLTGTTISPSTPPTLKSSDIIIEHRLTTSGPSSTEATIFTQKTQTSLVVNDSTSHDMTTSTTIPISNASVVNSTKMPSSLVTKPTQTKPVITKPGPPKTTTSTTKPTLTKAPGKLICFNERNCNLIWNVIVVLFTYIHILVR